MQEQINVADVLLALELDRPLGALGEFPLDWPANWCQTSGKNPKLKG